MLQGDEGVASMSVRRFQSGNFITKADSIAREEPLEIRLAISPDINSTRQSISVTMRTPGDDFELAVGFLFTETIIQDPDCIESISYGDGEEVNIAEIVLRPGAYFDASRLSRNFYTTSSCGVCGKTSLDLVKVQLGEAHPDNNVKVSPDVVSSLPDRMREVQSIYQHTGGLHASGLFSPDGELLIVREDVGRHNALDKLIGNQFLARRTPLSNTILGLSGRASFELVQKAAVAGIPVIVAVGAPSSLAVELAQEVGITLVGFAKRESFNIYTGAERIVS